MIRVMEGDCRAVLATLPAQSVQCCVTSPPYYGLRQYLPDGHPDMDKQIGLEKTPDEYVADMVAVFREVRRVLRDDGVLWLNIGDSYCSTAPGTLGDKLNQRGIFAGVSDRRAEGSRKMRPETPTGMKPKDLIGIPWMVAFALRADGWYLRSECIWAKPNPMPESVTDRPTKAHEQVFLLSKGPRYFYDADAIREEISASTNERWGDDPKRTRQNGVPTYGKIDGGNSCGVNPNGRNARTIWTIATQPYSGAHFATMPADLAERCIKAGSSEKGCCPHCGAPWGRVVERGPTVGQRSAPGQPAHITPQGYLRSGGSRCGDTATETVGWSPSCDCPPHEPIPCTILDPFGGAGTTALVADRLGRNATIVELNPEYAALARERVTADAGMFAQIGMEA